MDILVCPYSRLDLVDIHRLFTMLIKLHSNHYCIRNDNQEQTGGTEGFRSERMGDLRILPPHRLGARIYKTNPRSPHSVPAHMIGVTPVTLPKSTPQNARFASKLREEYQVARHGENVVCCELTTRGTWEEKRSHEGMSVRP
jgi:hypothetical protein